MTVHAILEQKGGEVFTVRSDDTLAVAAGLLAQHHIGALIVDRLNTGGNRHRVGIVSERDIVRACAKFGAQALQMAVSEVMTSKVMHCKPQDTVHQVMEVMTRNRFRHLPVVDTSGELVGIISIGDVVKRRIEQAERETEEIRHYIASA